MQMSKNENAQMSTLDKVLYSCSGSADFLKMLLLVPLKTLEFAMYNSPGGYYKAAGALQKGDWFLSKGRSFLSLFSLLTSATLFWNNITANNSKKDNWLRWGVFLFVIAFCIYVYFGSVTIARWEGGEEGKQKFKYILRHYIGPSAKIFVAILLIIKDIAEGHIDGLDVFKILDGLVNSILELGFIDKNLATKSQDDYLAFQIIPVLILTGEASAKYDKA